MTDNAKPVRGFTIFTESTFAASVPIGPGCAEEITIGLYHADGGTTGEFSVCWLKIGDKIFPRLEAHTDSWSALLLFADVLKTVGATSHSNPITPREFVATLTQLGVVDLTVRKR